MKGAGENLRAAFAQVGQEHIFAFWDHLDQGGRENLLRDAAEIDLEELTLLVREHVTGVGLDLRDLQDLQPAPLIARPENGGDPTAWARARNVGEDALRAGRVAAFTVAGGQGTRLGFDAPKGTFPVTPLKAKTLFQVFAEKIVAVSDYFGVPIPWFIMTSTDNDGATRAFFESHRNFSLPPDDIVFITQGRMPAVDFEGSILMQSKERIAMSPDGHGGSLRALVRSRATEMMRDRGIDAISYFQVDNPLVQCMDPEFIGFHLEGASEMSSKIVAKTYPGEKVGQFCVQNGHLVVIEYSDMPDELTNALNSDGALKFRAGSIAIHLLNRAFVERIGGACSDANQLPFHGAVKKVPFIDRSGNAVRPTQPNAVKFEMFVFDALPLANHPIVVETRRSHEFSPVKNAEGLDSPQTSREGQIRLATAWLKHAGAALTLDKEGLPPSAIEISPLFAFSEEQFSQRWHALHPKPDLDADLYLG